MVGRLDIQPGLMDDAFELALAIAQVVVGNDDGLELLGHPRLRPDDLHLGPLAGIDQAPGPLQLRLGQARIAARRTSNSRRAA